MTPKEFIDKRFIRSETDNCIRPKQTNFERIKAMSVEEMAVIIMCPHFRSEPCEGKDCNKCCKQWLESEVDEDD